MNLWIIYTNTYSYSKMISEIFENQLEDYFSVSMGNAEIVNPSLVLDEKPDFIIFGELFQENSINIISTWIEQFSTLSKLNNFFLKKVAVYYIIPGDLDISKTWNKVLLKYFSGESVFSKPLFLKIYTFSGSLDKETYVLIKNYIKDLIDFFLK